MREFFKYAYYSMFALVTIAYGLVLVSNDSVSFYIFLACTSVWFVLWTGLMLTRPVEYLYLIAYATYDNRTGRYIKTSSYKIDSIDKIKDIEDYLKNDTDVEKVMIQNIQLISKTYHE